MYKILFPFFFFIYQDLFSQAWKVQDLAWLHGEWKDELFGGKGIESWSGPEGNSMVGYFKLYNKSEDSTNVFELLTIVQEGKKIMYRFKHFSTDFVTWEDKPLTYELTNLDGKNAVFEMDETIYGKPKVLEYKLLNVNQLKITIKTPVRDQKDLKETEIIFSNHKSKYNDKKRT